MNGLHIRSLRKRKRVDTSRSGSITLIAPPSKRDFHSFVGACNNDSKGYAGAGAVQTQTPSVININGYPSLPNAKEQIPDARFKHMIQAAQLNNINARRRKQKSAHRRNQTMVISAHSPTVSGELESELFNAVNDEILRGDDLSFLSENDISVRQFSAALNKKAEITNAEYLKYESSIQSPIQSRIEMGPTREFTHVSEGCANQANINRAVGKYEKYKSPQQTFNFNGNNNSHSNTTNNGGNISNCTNVTSSGDIIVRYGTRSDAGGAHSHKLLPKVKETLTLHQLPMPTNSHTTHNLNQISTVTSIAGLKGCESVYYGLDSLNRFSCGKYSHFTAVQIKNHVPNAAKYVQKAIILKRCQALNTNGTHYGMDPTFAAQVRAIVAANQQLP